MSKLRILLAAVLCVSLLAFAGCGGNNDTTDGKAGNGTVTEDNTDMNNSNNNGSVMDDLENGAEDAVDDLEKDAEDAADGMRNSVDGNSKTNNTNNTKESTVGQ